MTDNDEAPLPLRDRLAQGIRAATKAGDTATLGTLRVLLSALDNATAVPLSRDHIPTVGKSSDVPRRELSADDMRQILRAESARCHRVIGEYERLGRGAEAERLRTEVAVIARYIDSHD